MMINDDLIRWPERANKKNLNCMDVSGAFHPIRIISCIRGVNEGLFSYVFSLLLYLF